MPWMSVCVRASVHVCECLLYLIDIGTVSIDLSRRLSVSSVLFTSYIELLCRQRKTKQSFLSILFTTSFRSEEKTFSSYIFQWQFIHSSHHIYPILSPNYTYVYKYTSHEKTNILNYCAFYTIFKWVCLCFRNVAHHIFFLSLSFFPPFIWPFSLYLSLFVFLICLFLFEIKIVYWIRLSLHTKQHTNAHMHKNKIQWKKNSVHLGHPQQSAGFHFYGACFENDTNATKWWLIFLCVRACVFFPVRLYEQLM